MFVVTTLVLRTDAQTPHIVEANGKKAPRDDGSTVILRNSCPLPTIQDTLSKGSCLEMEKACTIPRDRVISILIYK